MIALASDCLLFRTTAGECIPFSAEMISVELMGNTADMFDAEFIRHAAGAVFHYFRNDLGKKTITVAEFANALEKVLRGFVLTTKAAVQAQTGEQVLESDLRLLASESGKGCELFFFPRLRQEMRQRLQEAPKVLRFRGLRGCVMQLAGARRWTPRCRSLQEQIVTYMRECLSAEQSSGDLSLVVD